MRRFISLPLSMFCIVFAAFAQTSPIVVPPSQRNPFVAFRDQRVADSTKLENTKTALAVLRKRCDNQLVDSDMIINVHGDSLDVTNAEGALRKDDTDIKPVEDEIKKLIRDSKGVPVLFRLNWGGPLQLRVEHYFIENGRVYFWLSYDDLNKPTNCQ